MPHQAVLTWTESIDTSVDYDVYRGTSPGGESTTPVNSTPIAAGTTTYTDTTIPAPGTYYWVVKSTLGGAFSVPSNEVSAVILPAPPTNLALASFS